jgi:hypothetical protein
MPIQKIRSVGLSFIVDSDGEVVECSNWRKALRFARNEQNGFFLRDDENVEFTLETVICWSE